MTSQAHLVLGLAMTKIYRRFLLLVFSPVALLSIGARRCSSAKPLSASLSCCHYRDLWQTRIQLDARKAQAARVCQHNKLLWQVRLRRACRRACFRACHRACLPSLPPRLLPRLLPRLPPRLPPRVYRLPCCRRAQHCICCAFRRECRRACFCDCRACRSDCSTGRDIFQ